MKPSVMKPALEHAQCLWPQDPLSAPVALRRVASRVGADRAGSGDHAGPSSHGPSARPSPERPPARPEPEPELALPPLWAFVPLAEHAPPALPVSSAAAQAWVALKKALTRNDEEGMAPARQEEALRSLSETRLSHFVRPIDWTEVSLALERTAQPVAQSGVTFVVAPPYGGHGEVVEAWAERHGARLLETPTTAQVLAGDDSWRATWDGEGPWALPRLERFFFRSAHGLALVRRLLEEVAGGSVGQGLIGCDSWAWAFLRRVWPMPHQQVLTLQALDGEKLQRLLVSLSPPSRGRKLLFRDARSGSLALQVPNEGQALSNEITQLAAHCRGNAVVAREYWRRRLRTEPDDDAKASVLDEAEVKQTGEEVVWLSSAHLQQGLPGFPDGHDEETALVLHAMLLHGGLAEEMLTRVLPLPHHQCMALVLWLKGQGIVELRDGLWLVTSLAYNLVRSQLRARDLQTDPL